MVTLALTIIFIIIGLILGVVFLTRRGSAGATTFFDSLKTALDLGLKFFAVVAALFAAQLLQDQPKVTVDADVIQLVDPAAATQSKLTCPLPAASPGQPPSTVDPLAAVICRFNERVRNGQGTSSATRTAGPDKSVTLTQLPSSPAAKTSAASRVVETPDAVVHSITTVVSSRRRTEPILGTEVWVLDVPGSEPQLLGAPGTWDPTVVGQCDDRLVVINQRYGPAGCVPSTGALMTLQGSPGIPSYASDLVQATHSKSDDLLKQLEAIEQHFYYEARIVVTNEGKGNANKTKIAAPPGFHGQKAPDASKSPCPNPKSSGEFSFLLKGADSCEALFTSDPLPRTSAGPASPVFGATTESDRPWVKDAIYLTALAGAIVTILYLIASVRKPNAIAADPGDRE